MGDFFLGLVVLLGQGIQGGIVDVGEIDKGDRWMSFVWISQEKLGVNSGNGRTRSQEDHLGEQLATHGGSRDTNRRPSQLFPAAMLISSVQFTGLCPRC